MKPSNNNRFLRQLALLCMIMACWCTNIRSQSVTLRIIETTDVHGAVFPYDFIDDKPAAGSLSQVHGYVSQERNKADQSVLLLSAGDILQGQPAVYYYNFERPDVQHLYARVMNYMGYDAAAVGNHDIETGHAVYDKFSKELSFPWLAANAVRTTDGEPYFQPYTIVEKKGIRIAILGMVTPGIPNWLPAKIWEGMVFEDMLVTARKWIPVIRERESPDLVIGLFHSGVDFTYGNQTAETLCNENASRLVAEQIPGFDIIFAGHDHAGWNMTVRNADGETVYILGATSDARDVAVATVRMEFDQAAAVWQKRITGEIVKMQSFSPDSLFMQTFSSEFDEVKTYVSRPIGAFSKTVSARESLFGDSPFVDLVHKIQLELTGAEFSITAPLSSNAEITAGPVYVRDMFKLYRYENLLYTMRLTGKEIQDYMEFSYAGWFNRMNGPDDHLLNFIRDESGALIHSQRTNTPQMKTAAFNFDSVAGLEYIVDVSKPSGNRVQIMALADGRLFDLHAEYTVAVNSYRGNGGGDHLTLGSGIRKADLRHRIMTSTEKDLRYFLMKWIEQQGDVTPEPLGNWQVVPHEWWLQGRERDYHIIFGEEPGSG